MSTNTALDLARAQNPNFNWAKYHIAKDNLKRNLYRNEDDRMTDNAIVAQGNNLLASQKQWTTQEEVMAVVASAYGTKNMTNAQKAAIATIAYTMGLDPSPASGHLYAFDLKGQFTVMLGYKGLIYKAQQQRQFFMSEARPMTKEEREVYGVAGDSVAAIVKLYDMEKVAMAKGIGLTAEHAVIVGLGVWNKGEAVPTGRTGFWRAGIRATRDALNKLGIGFDTAPAISGFAYDAQEEVYIQNPDDFVDNAPRHPMPDGEWVFDIDIVERDGEAGDYFYNFVYNGSLMASFKEADLNGHKLIEVTKGKPELHKDFLLTVRLGNFVGDDEQDPRHYLMTFIDLKSK